MIGEDLRELKARLALLSDEAVEREIQQVMGDRDEFGEVQIGIWWVGWNWVPLSLRYQVDLSCDSKRACASEMLHRWVYLGLGRSLSSTSFDGYIGSIHVTDRDDLRTCDSFWLILQIMNRLGQDDVAKHYRRWKKECGLEEIP